MKLPSMRSITKIAMIWLQKRQAESARDEAQASLRIALSHIDSLEDLVLAAAADLDQAGHPDQADEYRRAIAARGTGYGPPTGQDGHVGAPGNASNSSATKEG